MATQTIYDKAVSHLFGGDINYLGGNIFMGLLANTYTPDFATNEFWADISANEITGTGYVADGYELVNKTFTFDSGTHLWTATNTVNPNWTGATFTMRYAVLYLSTGTGSTSPLLACTDFVTDQSVTADTYTLFIPTTGLLQVAMVVGS